MFSKERFGARTSGPFAAASPGPAEGAAGEQTGAAAPGPQVLLGRGARRGRDGSRRDRDSDRDRDSPGLLPGGRPGLPYSVPASELNSASAARQDREESVLG